MKQRKMPPPAANSGFEPTSQLAPGGKLNAHILDELTHRFAWPAPLIPLTRSLWDLSTVMDLGKLDAVAAAVSHQQRLGFTLISREYIQTGLNWIHAMRRIGTNNFFVVAGDQFTHDVLEARGIHSVRAAIDERDFEPSFISQVGFSSKGLAMITLKFPVARFLVKSGYSVIFSDADAVWLQDPTPHLQWGDVAFQRIDYHPAPVARLWGFAACTGFVCFRHGAKTLALLDRCIEQHQSLHCDQVAMNVALLQGKPEWHCDHDDWLPPGTVVHQDRANLRAAFARLMKSPITGELSQDGLQLLALPHDKFWRHHWITSSLTDMVVCHPNSPKDDTEKMKILAAMGVRFAPEAGDRE
jgi:hypothetical protein